MNTVKLVKWGNSQGIRISVEVLNQLFHDYSEKDMENADITFELIVKDGYIVLKPNVRTSRIQKLFEGFDGDPREYHVDYIWEKIPKGRDLF